MSRYHLTLRAERQLQRIFESSIDQFGEKQALKYQASPSGCFQLLADTPKLGRLSLTIRPGMRRHEHDGHVVIYREERNGDIVTGAILHKRKMLALKS